MSCPRGTELLATAAISFAVFQWGVSRLVVWDCRRLARKQLALLRRAVFATLKADLEVTKKRLAVRRAVKDLFILPNEGPMKIEPGNRVLLKPWEQQPAQHATVLQVDEDVITVEIDPVDRPAGDPDGLREVDPSQIASV